MSPAADSRGAHSGPHKRASWLPVRNRIFVPPADAGEPSAATAPASAASPDDSRPAGASQPAARAGLGDPGQVDSDDKPVHQPPARPRRRASGVFTRSTLLRVCGAVVALGVIAAGLLGGRSPGTSAETTVQSFLLYWEQGNYVQAAQLTTGNRAVVAAALRAAYTQLDAAALYLSIGKIAQSGNAAHAQFGASVDLGEDGAAWNYTGRFALHWTGSTWKVRWSPSVIVPGLRAGTRLAVRTTVPPRALVLDSAGQPLQQSSTAYVVGVRPDRLADPDATADGVGRATGLNSGQVLDQIRAAPQASFIGLLTLDPRSYAQLGRRLSATPGVTVRKVSQRLFDSIASEVVGSVGAENSAEFRQDGIAYQPGNTTGLSGLQQYYQRRLVGSPSTEVIIENSSGRLVSVLHKWPGLAGSPVRTTLSSGAQTAANEALGKTADAAAIVAVQASTGKILAVASRPSRNRRIAQPRPLAGRYPPGQAFTIVSTAALLGTGLPAAAPVPCATASDVGGETFINDPPAQGLGAQPPFSADFARGCGTAFAGLSRRLSPAGLARAAAEFGVGSSWRLPLPGFAGLMPVPATGAQVAADTMGAGNIQVSPLDMALIAAQVDSGQWHSPSLITSPADPSDPPLASKSAVSQQVMSTLRTLMRATVQTGTARQADLSGQPVYGQAGQARFSQGGKGVQASWFAGFRGDIAFAVLELGKSAKVSAVPLTARFLQRLSVSPPGR
jgi:cell division protein FtsI/penicillin-binding protein 2